MPISKADIANQALAWVGVGDEIQDLDTETSKEATACRRFYDVTVAETLRDFRWPFATVTQALAIVQDFSSVVGAEWGFSYRYPAACAVIHRLLNQVSRVETPETRIPYKIGRDSAGLLVYTDMPNVQAEFTTTDVPLEQFPPDVVDAIALLLGAKIAARFGPDAVKLGDRALKLYFLARGQAQKNALMEEQADQEAESSFVSARGGGSSIHHRRC